MKESAIFLVLDKIYGSFYYLFLRDIFILRETIKESTFKRVLIQKGCQSRLNMER